MKSRTILVLALAVVLDTTPLAQRASRAVSGAVISVKSGQLQPVSGVVISVKSGQLQPVVGALVQYNDYYEPTRTTKTNEDGYFYFPRVSFFDGPSSATPGVVTVTADGFATAYRRWPSLDGSELRILLDFPAVLQGTVEDAGTSSPVGAVITVMVEYGGSTVSMSTDTDTESGSFKIGDLPGGSATIIANAEGFAPFWSELTIDAGESRDARIRLLMEANVTGTVLNADGSPVHAAYVVASYPDEVGGYGLLESFTGGEPWTDTDGAFELYGLIPGVPVHLRAELDDGTLSDIVTVTVPSGTVQENVVLRFP